MPIQIQLNVHKESIKLFTITPLITKDQVSAAPGHKQANMSNDYKAHLGQPVQCSHDSPG
jgi:hypothetical protein